MPTMRCRVCKTYYEDEIPFLSSVHPYFCSGKCFLEYIQTSSFPDIEKTKLSLSSWRSERNCYERAFSNFLRKHKIDFEYETYAIDVYKGNSWYVPDYFLPKSGLFIEIKGRMDDRSKYKLSRFANKHPEHIIVLGSKALRRLGVL